MRFLYILPLLFAFATAQFNGFGGFGDFASSIQQGANSLISGLPLLNNVQNFADFAAQTGKRYATEAESRLREGVFNARKSLVDARNAAFAAGTSTFETAINGFADLTKAEFLKKLTGNRKSAAGDAKSREHKYAPDSVNPSQVPDSFDWREQGGVTPVKFQGDCGSCWSFATTGAIEGHVFRKTGRLPNLSEQNLIDCGKLDFGLNGCDGGFQEYAFDFVASQNGIANTQKYPYIDKKDVCKYRPQLKGAEITGFAAIPIKDEQKMKEIVGTLGPLACSIYGIESLLLYSKGIYDDEECNTAEVNHSVLVVGYGSENGKDYWIVKNSWDKNWGEEGFFKLPRGKNFCGIASECSYPII